MYCSNYLRTGRRRTLIRRDDHVCISEIIEVYIITGFVSALFDEVGCRAGPSSDRSCDRASHSFSSGLLCICSVYPELDGSTHIRNHLCWNSGGSLSMRIAAGNLRFLKGEDSRIVMRVAGYFTQGAMLSV